MSENVTANASPWSWPNVLWLLVWFGVPVLLCAPPWLIIRYGTEQVRRESVLLEREIRLVDAKLIEIETFDKARDVLLQRKAIIEQLGKFQALAAKPLAALGNLPPGIQIVKLRYETGKVAIEALCDEPALMSPILALLVERGFGDAQVVSRQRVGNGDRIRVAIEARPLQVDPDSDDQNALLLPERPLITRWAAARQP
jgi:Tfp pilus assembly protein PilN